MKVECKKSDNFCVYFYGILEKDISQKLLAKNIFSVLSQLKLPMSCTFGVLGLI